jgi:chloramphenicol-sensitive protein RarD
VTSVEESSSVVALREQEHHPEAPLGLLCGIAAYSCWGVIPLFFKLLKHLPPAFVLGERMVWSCVFFVALVMARGSVRELRQVICSRKTVLTLLVSALLVATNWGTFIYAVTVDKVLESSLGYFIAPLVVVALGVIVLHERFRKLQAVAIALAAVGVTVMTLSHGHLPWIGLVLALTFGSYGLFRKTVKVEPVVGLCVETALLTPIGVVMAAVMWRDAQPHVMGMRDWGLLVVSGPVTGVPLLLFTGAARRLRLSTIGLLQYIGPVGQFALAVFVYHEPFGAGKLAGFVLIWLALVLYSADSVRAYRDHARQMEVTTEPIPE